MTTKSGRLSAQSIRKYMGDSGFISPFTDKVDGPDIRYSYGLEGAGYTATLDKTYIPYPNSQAELIVGNVLEIPARSSFLLSTREIFHIPSYISGEVWGKSSIARQFGLVNTTLLEPGWTGNITVEFTNLGDEVIPLIVGQGFCQVVFSWLDEETDLPYSGRYQNQVGPQMAKEGK